MIKFIKDGVNRDTAHYLQMTIKSLNSWSELENRTIRMYKIIKIDLTWPKLTLKYNLIIKSIFLF
jgi:hypothetical protein